MNFAAGLLFCWFWVFSFGRWKKVVQCGGKNTKLNVPFHVAFKSWWKWNERGFYINWWKEKLTVDKGHKTLTSSYTGLSHLNLQLSLTLSCLDAGTQFFNSLAWQLSPENLFCYKENVTMIGSILWLLFWQIVSLEVVILPEQHLCPNGQEALSMKLGL